MKNLLFLFMLCLCGKLGATSIGLGYETAVEVPISGPYAVTGSATYALNQTTGTVRSSTIDTGALAGLFVSLTGTTGQVYAEYSGTNAAPWFTHYFIKTGWAGYVPKRARYVRFYADPATLTYTTASLMYWQATGMPVSGGSTNAFITGTVQVTSSSPTAGVTAYPVSFGFANRLTLAATTSGVALNISSAAQAAGKLYRYKFQLAGAGYWGEGDTAAVPANFGLYSGMTVSANVTPLQPSIAVPGAHAYFGAQAGTVNIIVEVFKSVP